MRQAVVALSLATLGACAPVAAPSPAPYKGVGTEPFWLLVIDETRITFTQPEGQAVRQPRPEAIIGFAGEIYQTPRINVNIVHAHCSDGMSDRIYPDKVQVTVDGRRFEGCGGL